MTKKYLDPLFSSFFLASRDDRSVLSRAPVNNVSERRSERLVGRRKGQRFDKVDS